jgi:transposase
MVHTHNIQTGDFRLNLRFQQFLLYWSLTAVACRPVRPRTKGKDEHNVQYVKSNCLPGHTFSSWDALKEHISWSMREVSDVHRHSTMNERPIDLFKHFHSYLHFIQSVS